MIKALDNNSKRLKFLIALAVIIIIICCLVLPGRIFNAPTSYVIEDADGNLLSASIAKDGQWRFPYNRSVPQKFIDCITTFEDKRFFFHPGVDWKAVARSAWINTMHHKAIQGGSTITMQVARLAGKNAERNIWNKLKETMLAIRLEMSYSKKEIIALYAANAPFGSNVVGLDAAAWRYFGRSADRLGWAEMATLCVLPNSPSLVHPGRNREILFAKRNRLLEKLYKSGKISFQSCTLSKLEPLPLRPLPLPQNAPHLLERFKKDHKNLSSSTKLRTTIDGRLQLNVTKILQQHHQLLRGNGINNICAIVLDVESGNTLAYVGNIYQSPNKEIERDVDVINSPRSPGSALKPILYAAMLSDGLILPGSLVPDIPTEIAGYTPKNFDLGFDGAVPASLALSRSLNIPAVRLLQQYKYQRFYEVLREAGISTLKKPADFYGLSMILGGCEVKLWELAGVYASFARILNHQVVNAGKTNPEDVHPPRYQPDPKKTTASKNTIVFDPASIFFTFQAMQEVMRPGEEGLWQQFSSSQKIAWKTGTSFGFRDGWAIGVTPKNVVAVWVGNADGEGRPGLIGIQTAAPVMFDIFRLLPNVSSFRKPVYNYSLLPVCRQTGFRANVDCPETDTLLLPPNAVKSPLCPYHKIIHLDAGNNFQVNENCESPLNMKHQSWFILPPVMEFYYRKHNQDYKLLPPYKTGCTPPEPIKQMELIYPQYAAKIYVPVEINGIKGKTIFTAAHGNNNTSIFWNLDNNFIATTETIHQIAISPSPGKHVITLTDEQGASISRDFEIIDKAKN